MNEPGRRAKKSVRATDTATDISTRGSGVGVEAGADARPMKIMDCALTALATGEEAQNLRELRDRIQRVSAGSLYYHFWGRLLRPVFEGREYHNDFANWAGYSLRDLVLAERLAIVDPAEYDSIDDLREELIEVLEVRLAEEGRVPWARVSETFHFIRSELVVFATGVEVRHPHDLPAVFQTLSLSSIYYHFIDARHLSGDGTDDFQRWLTGFGPAWDPLRRKLSQIDIYFTPLPELRDTLADLFVAYEPEPVR